VHEPTARASRSRNRQDDICRGAGGIRNAGVSASSAIDRSLARDTLENPAAFDLHGHDRGRAGEVKEIDIPSQNEGQLLLERPDRGAAGASRCNSHPVPGQSWKIRDSGISSPGSSGVLSTSPLSSNNSATRT
jgi:hypothetical protein